jgi:hypothetical protein
LAQSIPHHGMIVHDQDLFFAGSFRFLPFHALFV